MQRTSTGHELDGMAPPDDGGDGGWRNASLAGQAFRQLSRAGYSWEVPACFEDILSSRA